MSSKQVPAAAAAAMLGGSSKVGDELDEAYARARAQLAKSGRSPTIEALAYALMEMAKAKATAHLPPARVATERLSRISWSGSRESRESRESSRLANSPSIAMQRERFALWRAELSESRRGHFYHTLAATNVIVSFLAVCAEMQVLPLYPETATTWAVVDAFFVITFSLDLVCRALLNAFEPSFYYSSSTIHLILLVIFGGLRWHEHFSGQPDGFSATTSVYSCLRAFRIVRLVYVYREHELLTIILLTLRRAMTKTVITLALMTIVACIYAVAGVALFREASGFYYLTGRGLHYADE